MDVGWRSVGSRGSCVLCSLQLLLLHIKAVSLLTMLTQRAIVVKNPGDSIRLDCDFHEQDYNLFHCPVLWKKSQFDETSQINIMGNINAPFLATDRYRVEWVNMTPKYRLELHLTDLTVEDSGNYTCEIRGPESVVLDSVVHSLFVRAPVQHVIIANTRNLSELAPDYRSLSVLRLRANEPGTIRCIAIGGYPPPSLDIIVGKNKKTEQFRFRNKAKLHGLYGLKEVTYSSERYDTDYTPTASEDGKRLKCVVKVSELTSVVESVRLSVDYRPRIRCTDQQANVGDLNVSLTCTVDAKPRATSDYWVVDDSGTTLRHGDVVDGLWTVVDTERADGLVEVRLFMYKTTMRSFRRYQLVSENEVGTTRQNVQLMRIHRTSTGPQTVVDTGRTPNVRTQQQKEDPSNASLRVSSSAHILLITSMCCLIYSTWRRLL